MKHATPDDLATLVRQIIGSSTLAKDFNGVDIKADDDNADISFIRVIVHVKNLDNLSDEEVDTITSSIEGAFTQKDDRFPSVRFSEP